MKRFRLVICLILFASVCPATEPKETFEIWPGDPPTKLEVAGPEHVLEGRPRPFYQLTDISRPTVAVYLPDEKIATGAGILVCPGGGLQRLAIEHEGIEVAQWLTERGITAFVLKYRVPASAQIGLQDAQRAMSLVRSRSRQWDVDPATIGTMGFSAGGEIGAWMSTHFNQRAYEPIDSHDEVSCRPDFTVMVYPGGLIDFRTRQIKEEIVRRIDGDTPPMFFAHAFDDSCQNSLQMALALKQARVPAELHIYQEGGHGFGARNSGHPVAHWKQDFERWARSSGFLDSRWQRGYAQQLAAAIDRGNALPRISKAAPTTASISDARVIQKRLVRLQLANDRIAGFKGGAITEAAQNNLGIEKPLTGVLFRSRQLEAASESKLAIDRNHPSLIETELGFIVGVDIGYEVLTVQQAQDAVEKIVPVVEIPRTYQSQADSPLSASELIAANIGSDRFLVGSVKAPAEINVLNLPIGLTRDGNSLHQANSSQVKGSQWENLHVLMNEIVAQGYTIPAGSIIISGAIGEIHPAQAGSYTATFGELGEISFELIESNGR